MPDEVVKPFSFLFRFLRDFIDRVSYRVDAIHFKRIAQHTIYFRIRQPKHYAVFVARARPLRYGDSYDSNSSVAMFSIHSCQGARIGFQPQMGQSIDEQDDADLYDRMSARRDLEVIL